MSLADFQNPLANMPVMQQMQQTQQTQVQSTPVILMQENEEDVLEEQRSVRETKEQSEKDRINEEDTERGDTGSKRKLPRRRAARRDEKEKTQTQPRASDGVHGHILDIQA